MTQESGEPQQGQAVRFIFEYEDDDVRLVSQQWVDVAVTGFDLPERQALPPGNYVELRSAEGAPLADVPVREELGRSVEVFPEEPGQPITRTDVEHARGAFTVVAPAPQGVQQVAVVQVPPVEGPPEGALAAPAPEGARAARGRDLATFTFEPRG
jgi:hypothetical protein